VNHPPILLKVTTNNLYRNDEENYLLLRDFKQSFVPVGIPKARITIRETLPIETRFPATYDGSSNTDTDIYMFSRALESLNPLELSQRERNTDFCVKKKKLYFLGELNLESLRMLTLMENSNTNLLALQRQVINSGGMSFTMKPV
jgi:hypothetical protein